jgi:uncharacterized protein YbjT (DUF2867 family)
MKILVLGGTGTVGSQVVNELLARKMDVCVLTRSSHHAEQLPKGAVSVIGDLLDPKTIRSVFNDADGVFLLNAVSPTETHEGLMAVNGARMAGVKRIVYLSVPDMEKASHLPHFGSKMAIEHVIKASGIAYTILRPNNFFQNDYWFKEALMAYGVYPQPIGDIGLARVDVRDIAEAAVLSFLKSETEGQTYTLAGPDALTGKTTAEAWSRALGKPILYMGNDLDAWEKQMLEYLPPWMVFDFGLMYDYFQKKGLKAQPEDIDRQDKLLGHAPRFYEDFVKETALMWKNG